MKISQEKKILEILETQQYASVEELSAVLCVSTSTIRRSLEILQQKGLVTRTHGGVKINSDNSFSPSFTFRIHQNTFEKKKIALSAIKLIRNGDIIFLDGSTSAFYIAEYLKEFENIRVITNGIDTLSLLSKNKILAYSTGGQVSSENPSVLVGRYAEDMICNFHADIAFFSAQAMDNDGEIYDCFEDEIFLRRAMIKNAKTKVFLCDSTKVGKSSSYHLCSLKDIDYVASNLSLSNSIAPEKCLTL
ncbi:MAG: DeoR/GlpR transcriptional regulator [Clostridiales bacterium]|nr:DeoR/GlpR transcriptional regulator [Clostridiales bacterium]